METLLTNTIARIYPVDKSLEQAATAHLDNLTKPQGSLARLEDVAKRVYCIQGGQQPLRVDPVRMFTVAGDHGVVEENISLFPQAVTRQMVLNFLQGGAGINVLCRTANITLSVVDAGCVGGPFAPHDKLIDKRLGEGTKNFAKEPAMDRATCIKALCYGIGLATDAMAEGYTTIGIGEMGIGNTTPATALFSHILSLSPQDVAGPGAGASLEGVQHKAAVVAKALQLHAPTLEKADGIDVLATLGGFEIAIMAGIALGAARSGMILMVDGFISTAAYVAARHICPHVDGYAILSHASAEPGYAHVLAALEKQGTKALPLLHLDLRLGEGTGAALAVPLMRSAVNIFNDMATFDSANVSNTPCSHT